MLTLDSQVLLLLCSRLGLPKDSDLLPFTTRDWKPLSEKIRLSSLETPLGLVGQSADELTRRLDISPTEAQRIAALLQRSDRLSSELDRLGALGIGVVTRLDPDYPARYLMRLKDAAPIVLFYAGEPALLGQPGIAVVGSRHLDQTGEECAAFIGSACGLSGMVLYSGGARGVDTISTAAALQVRGSAVSILADSLERAVRDPDRRGFILRGDLCLATPYSPDAGFSVGAAMGRNRLIYCLADYAVVVASDLERGGTWAGAVEAIKAAWVPVFILDHPRMPEGSRRLLERGGIPFPYPFPETFSNLPLWLSEHGKPAPPKPAQLGMF